MQALIQALIQAPSRGRGRGRGNLEPLDWLPCYGYTGSTLPRPRPRWPRQPRAMLGSSGPRWDGLAKPESSLHARPVNVHMIDRSGRIGVGRLRRWVGGDSMLHLLTSSPPHLLTHSNQSLCETQNVQHMNRYKRRKRGNTPFPGDRASARPTKVQSS